MTRTDKAATRSTAWRRRHRDKGEFWFWPGVHFTTFGAVVKDWFRRLRGWFWFTYYYHILNIGTEPADDITEAAFEAALQAELDAIVLTDEAW